MQHINGGQFLPIHGNNCIGDKNLKLNWADRFSEIPHLRPNPNMEDKMFISPKRSALTRNSVSTYWPWRRNRGPADTHPFAPLQDERLNAGMRNEYELELRDIAPAEVGARDLKRKVRYRTTHFWPSLKNRRTILVESKLERDCAIIFDADPNVISYQSQPLTIGFKGRSSNKPRSYTPDFKVECTDGTYLVEVKPDTRFAAWMNEDRSTAIARYCEKHGVRFKPIAGSEITNGPDLAVARRITRAFYIRQSAQTVRAVKEFVGTQGTTLGELLLHAQELSIDINILCGLHANDCISIVLSGELSCSTLVLPR